MLKEKPSKTPESLSFINGSFTPLFFTDLIHCIIEGFDYMKTIQNEGGVGTMFLNGADVGLAHITTGPCDLPFLIVCELLCEEFVDGLTALSPANPKDTGSVQVIDDRGVFTTLTVRDLIDPDRLKSPDSVTLPDTGNGSVQHIGKSGFGDVQDPGSGFLGH
jgi:hypothetical protein